MVKKIAKKAPAARNEQPVKTENLVSRCCCSTPKMIIGIVVIIALSVLAGMFIATPATAANCSSSDAAVCSVNSGLSVALDPVLSCGNVSCSASEGKVSVIAFYSPTCSYCEAQSKVFDQLKTLYGDNLDIQYACRNVHSGDDTLCIQNNGSKYLDWNTSKALAAQYGADQKGTPVVVFNCKYQRYGSLALQNQTLEYNELKTIIDGLM